MNLKLEARRILGKARAGGCWERLVGLGFIGAGDYDGSLCVMGGTTSNVTIKEPCSELQWMETLKFANMPKKTTLSPGSYNSGNTVVCHSCFLHQRL